MNVNGQVINGSWKRVKSYIGTDSEQGELASLWIAVTLLRDDGRTFEIAVGGALGRIQVTEK